MYPKDASTRFSGLCSKRTGFARRRGQISPDLDETVHTGRAVPAMATSLVPKLMGQLRKLRNTNLSQNSSIMFDV